MAARRCSVIQTAWRVPELALEMKRLQRSRSSLTRAGAASRACILAYSGCAHVGQGQAVSPVLPRPETFVISRMNASNAVMCCTHIR